MCSYVHSTYVRSWRVASLPVYMQVCVYTHVWTEGRGVSLEEPRFQIVFKAG